MPKVVVPVRFVPSEGTGYLQDIGIEIAGNSRFNLPPDIANTEIDNILTAIGAQTLANVGDSVPCSDNPKAKLRKLQFIRDNGNTMSVPVSSRANLITAATTIRGILNAGAAEVVCIKLMGEYFPNLADELGLTYAGDFATSHRPQTGGKQFVYSGNISYETDATSGTIGTDTVFHPVRSISDLDNAPSTQLTAAWAGCVGSFTQALACRGKGKRNPRKHRRFILTFATKVDPLDVAETAATETAELPAKDADATALLTCGQNAAGLAGAYCIGYQGESYARYHKLLP